MERMYLLWKPKPEGIELRYNCLDVSISEGKYNMVLQIHFEREICLNMKLEKPRDRKDFWYHSVEKW